MATINTWISNFRRCGLGVLLHKPTYLSQESTGLLNLFGWKDPSADPSSQGPQNDFNEFGERGENINFVIWFKFVRQFCQSFHFLLRFGEARLVWRLIEHPFNLYQMAVIELADCNEEWSYSEPHGTTEVRPGVLDWPLDLGWGGCADLFPSGSVSLGMILWCLEIIGRILKVQTVDKIFKNLEKKTVIFYRIVALSENLFLLLFKLFNAFVTIEDGFFV